MLIQFLFNVTSNTSVWYVGIFNPRDDVVSGIWYGSLCAPDCEDHGKCETTGLCNCIEGFVGVDCNTASGLGPQFIVLIIIAALVLLTAIIGFVAWAYMRKRRENDYSKI